MSYKIDLHLHCDNCSATEPVAIPVELVAAFDPLAVALPQGWRRSPHGWLACSEGCKAALDERRGWGT